MKKILLYTAVLMLTVLHVAAQYNGGAGRGEIGAVANGLTVGGDTANIYAGGAGRGETILAVINNTVGGDSLNIYGGGKGRGEVITMIGDNTLRGDSLNIYGGGGGRGEVFADTGSVLLTGENINIYGGGTGRGETYLSENTLALNGDSVASMFLGGAGRGESSVQLNFSALPVTLLSFGASLADKEIKVLWQTASELNSAYFVVEKSLDGLSWQSIGKINAAGHSDAPLSYQFFDTHPVEGINYYRLKPTDLDGKFAYSSVAAVRYHEGSIAKINVYPNPVKYQFTVAVQGLQSNAKLHISLVNAMGQTVFNKENLTGGTHTFDIANLAGGTYFLMVNNNGDISTIKIVKE